LFCDRRFADLGPGSVNQYLPRWVRDELILADAKEGRNLILAKVGEWNIMQIMPMNANPSPDQEGSAASKPRAARAKKTGKRDLRELARSLGLGGAPQKSPAAKSAPKKPGR